MITTAPPLPPAFVERMQQLLGVEAKPFFDALNEPARAGLRVNTLKIAPEQLRQRVPFALEPVPWCRSGFYVGSDARPGKHPYHAAGLYYLQEPSAMAVVEALDIRPSQRVLDLAASPGGKATQIAALLGRKAGLLVANEVEGSRIKALGENLERWGARNVLLTSETVERLAAHFGASFERVLLDAPCSGEGMFRKNAAARSEWSVGHVEGCALRQHMLLEQAAQLVAPGGLLVYSTCTFAPEENEGRIAAFLGAHPGWQLEPIPLLAGFVPAQSHWSDPPLPELVGAVRLWPHRVAGEGHFIARLRHAATVTGAEAPTPFSSPARPKDERARPLPRPTHIQAPLEAWHSFERTFLNVELPPERLLAVGEQVYLAPEELPHLGSLRVVRPGLWLGTSKPGRFEPSHALALALTAGEAKITAALADAEVERYLWGETVTRSGPAGWVLLTIDGWPLGWGRHVGETIKNFYPKGLRGKH